MTDNRSDSVAFAQPELKVVRKGGKLPFPLPVHLTQPIYDETLSARLSIIMDEIIAKKNLNDNNK